MNGVLQQEGLYTVTADNVEIQTDEIPEDAPITLIVTNLLQKPILKLP